MLKKALGITISALLALSLCACGGDRASQASSGSGASQETASTAELKYSVDKAIDYTIEGGSIRFDHIERAGDDLTDADDVLLFVYDFTNAQDKPSQAQGVFWIQYFQNGVELKNNLSYYTNANQHDLVQSAYSDALKGGTVTFAQIVQPKDDSPITVMVSPNPRSGNEEYPSMVVTFDNEGAVEDEETVVSTEPAAETTTVYVMTQKTRIMDYLPDLSPDNIYYDDFKFDKKGRLVSEHELWDDSAWWDNTITFEYADDGTLAKKVETITTASNKDGYQLISTYNEHGDLISVESTGGEDDHGKSTWDHQPGTTFDYTYDNEGKLVEMSYNYGDGTPVVNKYTYDDSGALVSYWESSNKGAGYTTTCTYDENGNLIREDVVDESDGDHWHTSYTYEAVSVEVEK